MFLVFIFTLLLFFFLSARLGGFASLPVWRHLISFCLLLLLSNKKKKKKKTIFTTNYSLFFLLLLFFLKRCVIKLPCMLDMYGVFFVCFFPFLCLKMVLFLSDDSSMAFFILHFMASSLLLLLLLFFADKKKKWQDFLPNPPTTPPPPPPPPTHCNLYKCISAALKCTTTIGLSLDCSEWVRYAFLMEVDRRGSCEREREEGGERLRGRRVCCVKEKKKTSIFRKSNLPRKFILLF